jgi:hypothetical protein
VDFAAEIDSEVDTLADEWGIKPGLAEKVIKLRDAAVRREQAATLAKIIGLLISCKNLPVMVRSLAIAFGFDNMNGYHSQSEVAKELGVTRALVSHYVLGWRDVLKGGVGNFECVKFRKHNETRDTFKRSAQSPFMEAKRKAIEKLRNKPA